MTVRRTLVLICLVAALHGLLFISYQRPDWYTEWSDQDGYRRLGAVLAETGTFTRFPDAPRFVPEVVRTPGYPIFVAVVYRIFGARQLPVALAQTGLIVLTCLLVYGIGRRVAPERIALGAAAATSLFPPLPYFGALVMTEMWTTFLFTLAMWLTVAAFGVPGISRFAVLGLLLALTALSRPVFVLFPIVLAAAGTILVPRLGVTPRPTLRHWTAMLAAFALAMLPWLMYNYAALGRFTLSPAGGVGRGLWEGSWQATWSGRLQNELTHLADDYDDRAALDREVAAVAAREHLPADRMLQYVHQWQDIRRIWVDPVDPYERALARVKADQEYLRVGMANIRRDPPLHLIQRLARGLFILWAGEIPFRYSDINQLPPIVIYACWAVQAAIIGAAFAGAYALGRSGIVGGAVVLLVPFLYISVVHVPLLTEARQSLPAMPVVLLLAAIGAADIARRSPRHGSRSRERNPQELPEHEAQHQ